MFARNKIQVLFFSWLTLASLATYAGNDPTTTSGGESQRKTMLALEAALNKSLSAPNAVEIANALSPTQIPTADLTQEAKEAKALFEAAMREQITKVVNMGLAADPNNAKAPDAAAITAYVKIFLDRYDKATTNDAKLNVVLKQAWYSNWGNGLETYNAFRRTGFPNDVQVPIARRRNFPLRLPQPGQETSLNKNAPQTPVAFDRPEAAVFWDVLKFAY